MFKKVVGPVYVTYAAITFLISFIIAFPIVVCLSRGSGSNVIARRRINSLTKAIFGKWFLVVGMPLQKIGTTPPGRYVYVANHNSYLDDIIIFPAIRGHFLTLGKKEMAHVPIWGYYYKHMVVQVDRKDPESRARSMEEMNTVLTGEGSILIFPEGTFNETDQPLKDFYDGAFRLAINAQNPIAPVIFPDIINRAHYSGWWKLWPGRNRIVYLPPVPVAGLTLNDIPALKQKVYSIMEDALIKYRTIK